MREVEPCGGGYHIDIGALDLFTDLAQHVGKGDLCREVGVDAEFGDLGIDEVHAPDRHVDTDDPSVKLLQQVARSGIRFSDQHKVRMEETLQDIAEGDEPRIVAEPYIFRDSATGSSLQAGPDRPHRTRHDRRTDNDKMVTRLRLEFPPDLGHRRKNVLIREATILPAGRGDDHEGRVGGDHRIRPAQRPGYSRPMCGYQRLQTGLIHRRDGGVDLVDRGGRSVDADDRMPLRRKDRENWSAQLSYPCDRDAHDIPKDQVAAGEERGPGNTAG